MHSGIGAAIPGFGALVLTNLADDTGRNDDGLCLPVNLTALVNLASTASLVVGLASGGTAWNLGLAGLALCGVAGAVGDARSQRRSFWCA